MIGQPLRCGFKFKLWIDQLYANLEPVDNGPRIRRIQKATMVSAYPKVISTDTIGGYYFKMIRLKLYLIEDWAFTKLMIGQERKYIFDQWKIPTYWLGFTIVHILCLPWLNLVVILGRWSPTHNGLSFDWRIDLVHISLMNVRCVLLGVLAGFSEPGC